MNKNEEHKSINVSLHGRSKKGILSQVWLRDNPDKVWLKEKIDQVSLNLLRSYIRDAIIYVLAEFVR